MSTITDEEIIRTVYETSTESLKHAALSPDDDMLAVGRAVERLVRTAAYRECAELARKRAGEFRPHVPTRVDVDDYYSGPATAIEDLADELEALAAGKT